MKNLLMSFLVVSLVLACRAAKFSGYVQEDGVVSDRPLVAIMIVGVQLNVRPGGTQASLLARHTQTAKNGNTAEKNLVQVMTGGDAFDASDASDATDSDTWPGAGESDIWKTTVERLIIPMAMFSHLHTYVCVDEAQGLAVPGQVSAVFKYNATSQFDRAAQCVSKVKQTGNHYSWFIKTRPDFFAYNSWPDVTKFDPDYVYTRFRQAGGISGLRSHAMSLNTCGSECTFAPGHGYLNDDMVVVASSKLIDHVFNSTSPAPLPLVGHASDFTIANWPGEGAFTKMLINNHILSMPLELPGCPLHSWPEQCTKSYPCRNSPKNLSCGNDEITMSELHRRMRASAR